MQEFFVDEKMNNNYGICYNLDKFIANLRKIGPEYYEKVKKEALNLGTFNDIINCGRFICILSLNMLQKESAIIFVDVENNMDKAIDAASKINYNDEDKSGGKIFMKKFEEWRDMYNITYSDFDIVLLKESLSDEVYNLRDFIKSK